MNICSCVIFQSLGQLNLGREPEDLECVERGREGDLLRRLLEVGRNHLHGDGQRARLVALERAVPLQERLRPEKPSMITIVETLNSAQL